MPGLLPGSGAVMALAVQDPPPRLTPGGATGAPCTAVGSRNPQIRLRFAWIMVDPDVFRAGCTPNAGEPAAALRKGIGVCASGPL